jgi:hypothetical protein
MVSPLQNRINRSFGICIGINFALACMLALAGCGPSQMQIAGTEEDALEVLTIALDAWKSGEKPDELKQESPPMYVQDEDWTGGRSLKDFKPHDAPKEFGGEWRVLAMLTLDGGGMPEEQKLVAYSVTTAAKAIVITRSDRID